MSLTLKEYLGKYHAARNTNTCKNVTSISMYQDNDFQKNLTAKIASIKKTIKKNFISKEVYQSVQRELDELKQYVLKNRNQFPSKISKKNSFIDTSSINLRSNEIRKTNHVFTYNHSKNQNLDDLNKTQLQEDMIKIKIKTEPNDQKQADKNNRRFLKTMAESSDSTVYQTSSKFQTSRGFINQNSNKNIDRRESNKMMIIQPPSLQQSFINIQVGEEDSQIRKTYKGKPKFNFIE